MRAPTAVPFRVAPFGARRGGQAGQAGQAGSLQLWLRGSCSRMGPMCGLSLTHSLTHSYSNHHTRELGY